MSSSVKSSRGARAIRIPAFFPQLRPSLGSRAVLNFRSFRHHCSRTAGVSSVEALSITITSNRDLQSCAASAVNASGRKSARLYVDMMTLTSISPSGSLLRKCSLFTSIKSKFHAGLDTASNLRYHARKL